MIINLVTSFLLLVMLGSLSNAALAQHFTSDSYIIDWGNFNITSGKKSSDNYRLTDTVGQIAPGAYQNTGFLLKSGFQYIYQTSVAFSFSIDNLDINFGILTPGIASTATSTISISTPSGHGYQITSQENHPLSTENGTTIPDTPCDIACSESSSQPWINSSTFGFGFNALGINSSGVVNNVGTSSYFSDQTYFRQFANVNNSPPETPQVFMSENLPVSNHQARITYKVNISSIQSAGIYQNYIVYTAVPRY